MAWIIKYIEEEQRGLLRIEGSASSPEHGSVNQFTIMLGNDFITLDLSSPWTSSLAFYNELTSLLGQPEKGLTPFAVGELMDVAYEGHAQACWNFETEERAAIMEKLHVFLTLPSW